MKLKWFMVLFAGSYDHTVKLFDARTKSSVMTIEHGQPVESVLLFPSGGLLVSAGNSVKSNFFFVALIWEILNLILSCVVFSFGNKVVSDISAGFLKDLWESVDLEGEGSGLFVSDQIFL